MSSPKLKSENYNSLGGINTKVSPHLNTPLEFLDIVNYDFQTPGALTSRWGTTTIFTTGASGQLPQRTLSIYNFTKSTGASELIFSGAAHQGASGFIYKGYDYLSALTGISLNEIGATLHIRYHSAFSVEHVNDPVAPGGVPSVSRNTWLFDDSGKIMGTGGVTLGYPAHGDTGNAMSWVSYGDWAFGADGNKFIKYNGTSLSVVGLVPATNAYGGSFVTTNSATVGFGYAGSWVLYGSYINNRGFEGEPWPLVTINLMTAAPSASLMTVQLQVETPLRFGISSINVYGYFASGVTLGTAGTTLFGLPYRFLKNIPASGSTTTWLTALGTTIGGQSLLKTNLGALPDTTNQYRPIGITYAFNGTWVDYLASINFNMIKPSILEIHKDRLFAAGFSASPRTTYYSDVGEPEGFDPENQFDLSSQDGEPITAMKSYRGQLYIFTRNSVHVLSGDNAANFSLAEITREFGCVNKFCVTQFNNSMAFLDRKGLVSFNGANFDRLSDKIQGEFDIMVANENCRLFNDQTRKQLSMAFPQTGASTNSRYLNYSYDVNAWSRNLPYYRIDAFGDFRGVNNFPEKTVIYGNNNVVTASSSLLTTEGIEGGSVGITLGFKTRFIHDMGDSSQKMFRRLYINTLSQTGTMVISARMYQDYGTSIVYSTTMTFTEFQNRIDFGISGKSIAFEIYKIQNNPPFKLGGFTMESRKLRGT